MNKGAKFWIILFIGLFIISNYLDNEDYDNIPPMQKKIPYKKGPPPLPNIRPEGEGKLRNPSFNDPMVMIESGPKSHHSMSTGTAFSIDKSGLWVTAKHVTKGCDSLVVLTSQSRGYKVTGKFEHPKADVSLLKTNGGAYPFNFEAGIPDYNAEGFHYGYPRGNPGDVYSRLIGRRTMKTKGTPRGRQENVLVWAERLRWPDHNLSLGGISGGPILNNNGNVAGIHVAGSVRRGRSYSSLPSAANYLVKKARVRLSEMPREEKLTEMLSSSDFSKAGKYLRKRLSVAKVVCIVK
jgi:hypothetical protein